MNAYLLLLLLLVESECKRFLFIPMHWEDSHKKSMLLFAEELAKMGHEVAIWQTTPKPRKRASKIVREIHEQTEIVDSDYYRDLFVCGNVTSEAIWETDRYDSLDDIFIWYLTTQLCRYLVNQNPERLRSVSEEGWDLIFVGSNFAPCGYIIQRLSKAPYISYATNYIFGITAKVRGINYQLVTAPNMRARYNFDHLKFSHSIEQIADLIKNLVCEIASDVMMMWYLSPMLPLELSMQANFEHGALFSFGAIPNGVDVAVPQSPAVKYVGELHCSDEIIQLPSKYDEFVSDNSSKGTIVAAFGHFLDWNSATPAHINMFIDTFKKLKDYRIIWQYTGNTKLPLDDQKHIRIDTWLSQKALLQHPNTVIFITHGGMKSTMEGTCSNISMIFIPMFAEQEKNSWMMQKHGFSKAIDKMKPNAKALEEAIVDVLQNVNAMAQKRAKFQERMTDHLMKPPKLGEFWTLFALRHQNEIDKWFNLQCTRLGKITHYGVDHVVIYAIILCVLALCLSE